MSYRWKIILVITFLATIVVWISVFSFPNNLKIVSCNVGQGDASLITYKSTQILIDSGPDNSVLGCLSKHMPFWDRKIDVVVLTHPQADHYSGLLAVFERYKVDKILANSLDVSSQSYSLLKSLVLSERVRVVNPTSGMSVRWGLIQLDILHPTKNFLEENSSSLSSSLNLRKDMALKKHTGSVTSGHSGTVQNLININSSRRVGGNNGTLKQFNHDPVTILGSTTSSLDPNEFSVVALLNYGSFRFLFTGDISGGILDSVASRLLEKGEKSINYIKIPHHGSKNSISEKMYDIIANNITENCHSGRGDESSLQHTIFNLQYTNCIPPLAVISVGKNSFGHPSGEVLKRLNDRDIEILRTDQIGDIVVETDGRKMWLNK